MPMPSFKTTGLSSAVDDLGMGDMLTEQVAGETEEARKKRMQQMQDRAAMGPGGSLATMSLFGGGLNGGYGA